MNWPVLLTVTSPVPEWATAGHDDKNLVTRPDDKDFKEFMTAVACTTAAQVSLFAIWNEPNHPAFLQPQFNTKGKPESPRIYRGLFQAGYEGLQRGGDRQTEGADGRNRARRVRHCENLKYAKKVTRPCCTTWRRLLSCVKRCA